MSTSESSPVAAADGLRVHVYLEAARRRELAARQLLRRRAWVGALQLYLEAASLLMRAKLVESGYPRPLDELSRSDLPGALLEVLKREGLAVPPELDRLHALLSTRAWDALDQLEEGEAERASRELDEATRFLAGTILCVQEAERRRERIVFSIGTALLAIGISGAGIGWLARPTNLALGRPVTATAPALHSQAEEAVNGVRFGELGYHSVVEGSPWLRVDLEAERTVHRIQIYGRGDCCLGQSMPMVVEGSIDGDAYVVLGRRDEPFHRFRPWTLTIESAHVRYVRVRTLRRTPLVVAELELY